MKKIDFYILVISAILIFMAVRAYILNEEFVHYLLFGVVFFLSSFKGLFSKRVYKILRIVSIVVVLLYFFKVHLVLKLFVFIS